MCQKRLIIAGWLLIGIFAGAGFLSADYNPEVKTKGSVRAGGVAIFADESGRFIMQNTQQWDEVELGRVLGLVSNTATEAWIMAEEAGTLAGDVEGRSTNVMVVRLKTVPIADLETGPDVDGFGLKYDDELKAFVLGPVATEGGTISNIVMLSYTAKATDVPVTNIATYRIMRPGDLPSMVLNVGGQEVAYFDLLGVTLRAGTINLLGDDMKVNVQAYDGNSWLPAYSWQADKTLGKHRITNAGGSGEAFVTGSNTVWWWDSEGIHLEDGKKLFGDSHAVLRSDRKVAKTSEGGYYTGEQVILITPKLLNGFAGCDYVADGSLGVEVETSADGSDWGAAKLTAEMVYVRLSAVAKIPSPIPLDLTISNIVVWTWVFPELVGVTNDTAGQVLLVDLPNEPRAVVNKQALDGAIGRVTPDKWAKYPACDDVDVSGHKIRFGKGWTMEAKDGVSVLSFEGEMHADNDGFVLSEHSAVILSASGGMEGCRISEFQVGESDVTISTTNAPEYPLFLQYTASLLAPAWHTLSSSVATNGGVIEFCADLPEGKAGYFRLVAKSGEVQVVTHGEHVAEKYYFKYESPTNWIGMWADDAGIYMGKNSNGTLNVKTNAW